MAHHKIEKCYYHKQFGKEASRWKGNGCPLSYFVHTFKKGHTNYQDTQPELMQLNIINGQITMYAWDRNSGQNYLVDSGAVISAFPAFFSDKRSSPKIQYLQ